MRTVIILPCCLALAAILTGCGESGDRQNAAPAAVTPGAAPSSEPYSEGGSLSPFYGEIFHEGRFYLFGTKVEFTNFAQTHTPNPLICKNYIGKGPNHETVICQKPKESPSMAGRLLNQFRKRHGLPPVE